MLSQAIGLTRLALPTQKCSSGAMVHPIAFHRRTFLNWKYWGLNLGLTACSKWPLFTTDVMLSANNLPKLLFWTPPGCFSLAFQSTISQGHFSMKMLKMKHRTFCICSHFLSCGHNPGIWWQGNVYLCIYIFICLYWIYIPPFSLTAPKTVYNISKLH